MLTLALLLADTQEIGPTGTLVVGGICFLVGVWFSIAVFSDRLRGVFRWNEDGSGPAMSPLGAGAAALNGYLLAAMFIAQALGWQDVASFTFYLVFGAIVLAILAAFRDYARSRDRI
jgi:small-conductance mechanosensitive channel